MTDETKKCPYCGEEINVNAKKCKHCGEWLDKVISSKELNKKDLPEEYKKFNWGAFLFPWIWGIANKTYISLITILLNLLSAIPFVGLVFAALNLGVCIGLGIKGNELAWKNNTWKSLEDFNVIQQSWAAWCGIITGIIIFIVVMVILCAGSSLVNY